MECHSTLSSSQVFTKTQEASSNSAIMEDNKDTTMMKDIQEKLAVLIPIRSDIASLKSTIEKLVQAVHFSELQLNEAHTAISTLKSDNEILKEHVTLASAQSDILNRKIVELDDYSRRENVLICGLPEEREENCFIAVKNLFTHIGGPTVQIQRCHRLGMYKAGRTRDIIVRLVYFQDKIEILRRRRDLPQGVYINEDYSPETKRHVNALRPVLKEALKSDRSAKLIKDKLIIIQTERVYSSQHSCH